MTTQTQGFVHSGLHPPLALVATTLLLAVNTAAAQDVELEEIVVTGTRIIRQDFESASPIVTVSSTWFDLYGSSSVQTALLALPQFSPYHTETANNHPGLDTGGQDVMDLRGLGLGRTLVLLDGRRIVATNAWGAVDVNLIPQAIVGSVEIITGGASAVYGSDAIAGVVNFRTRRYTGLGAEANWEQTDRGEGIGWHAGVTGGLEFSRGYAYGHFGYTDRGAVMSGDRKFSAVNLQFDGEIHEFVPYGSGIIRQGRWNQTFGNRPTQAAIDSYLANADPNYVPGAIKPSAPFGFNQDGSLFSMSPVYNFTGDRNEPLQPVNPDDYSYNFAPANYLRTPTERSNFFGRAGLDVAEGTGVYLQVLWADYTTHKELAATPMTGVYIGADNPFIHPDFAALLASRPDPGAPFRFAKRMTDLGPRRASYDYQVWQLMTGIQGALGHLESWRYDAYVSWGESDQVNVKAGNVSMTAFEELSMAPDAGASICGGEGMNPFGINSIASGCAAYFTRNARDHTSIRQIVAEATASGPVFELPAGSGQLAVGLQYREDEYDSHTDPVLTARRIDPVYGIETSDIQGFGVRQPVDGQTDSREVFVELSVPILVDRPYAKSLNAVAGYRYGDHSSAGAVNAWKGEFTWQVAAPLTLRSSYQRAVRAPDFISLYQRQVVNSVDLYARDPCDYDFDDPNDYFLGAQQDPDVAALCIAQGIPVDVLPTYADSDGAVDVIEGGNPDLREESADTFTVGVVLRSPWGGALANLQASVDYYDIEIDDVISYVDYFVYPCYERLLNPDLDPDNFYCRRFERDPVTYEITNVLNTAVNFATMATSGYDLQVDYAVEAGPGRLRLNTVVGYTDSATMKTQGAGIFTSEFAGKATWHSVVARSADFSFVPRWKAVADLGYAVGQLSTNLRWRYIASLQDQAFEGFRLPSRQYFDLTLGYRFESGFLEGLSLHAGVTNLTDEQPVIYPSALVANTAPAVYDVLGRRYFLRAKYAL